MTVRAKFSFRGHLLTASLLLLTLLDAAGSFWQTSLHYWPNLIIKPYMLIALPNIHVLCVTLPLLIVFGVLLWRPSVKPASFNSNTPTN